MKNKTIYLLLIALLVCIIIILGMILKNKSNEPTENVTNNSSVEEKKQVVYYSFNDKLDFVFSSMATKVDDYNKINNKVLVKETITKETSTETMYEISDNLEFDGKHYLYGIFTKELLDKFEMFDETKCDTDFEKDMGEGTTRICKKHEPGFAYDKIDSEMLVKTNNSVITIKANDWDNVDNYKKDFEDAGWKCENNGQSLKCDETSNELRVYVFKTGEVSASENSSYYYVNNDYASWCNTIK